MKYSSSSDNRSAYGSRGRYSPALSDLVIRTIRGLTECLNAQDRHALQCLTRKSILLIRQRIGLLLCPLLLRQHIGDLCRRLVLTKRVTGGGTVQCAVGGLADRADVCGGRTIQHPADVARLAGECRAKRAAVTQVPTNVVALVGHDHGAEGFAIDTGDFVDAIVRRQA